MASTPLHVLTSAEAADRPVLERTDPASTGPLFVSFGLLDLLCGVCAFALVQGWAGGVATLRNAVLVCPSCHGLNGL